MPERDVVLQPPSTEHRRIAVGQFERANQVIATANYDYGIRLLLSCCKLDPANLIYRQALRRTEKTKYKNNLRGSWMAWLTTSPLKARVTAARTAGNNVQVLDLTERILAKNPWDTGAQLDQAAAADDLGLIDLAVWTLEQARQKNPKDLAVNRPLARLYEKRGNFVQAIALWELIHKEDPRDKEAQTKAKDLAATETISRGQYQEAISHRDDEDAPEQKDTPTISGPGGSGVLRKKGLKDVSPSADRATTEAAKLQARVEADPTNPTAWLALAHHYRRNGKIDKARETLEQGLQSAGTDFNLSVELADVEIEPFRRNLFIAEEKLRHDAGNEMVRKNRVGLLREINSRELELFRRKADRFPNELGHRLELGVRLLRAGQSDEAIKELQAARADPRHLWRALMYLGYCFKGRNNWRLARRNFEEALQNLPAGEDATRKEVMFQIAAGCAEAGDLAAAVDVGHELANLDYGYREIGRLLDEWQTQLTDSET